MKLLNVKLDVVSIQLDDGRIVLVKEQELVILGDGNMNKCKVGYDDAVIMSLALKMIFADIFEELKELRELRLRIIEGAEKEIMETFNLK